MKINDPRLEEWQNDALNMTEAERRGFSRYMARLAEMVLRTACIGCPMVSDECPDRCARARRILDDFE